MKLLRYFVVFLVLGVATSGYGYRLWVKNETGYTVRVAYLYDAMQEGTCDIAPEKVSAVGYISVPADQLPTGFPRVALEHITKIEALPYYTGIWYGALNNLGRLIQWDRSFKWLPEAGDTVLGNLFGISHQQVEPAMFDRDVVLIAKLSEDQSEIALSIVRNADRIRALVKSQRDEEALKDWVIL